jgi:hypothetical protein
MYKEEKIKEMIAHISESRKATGKGVKPYLAIAQPRRDAKEQAAQKFPNDKLKFGTFLNHYSSIYLWTDGQMVDTARNMLCEQAIQHDAKYMFFIGEDTVVPYTSFLDLHMLAEANPDAVVSGVYYFKGGEPMVFVKDEYGYLKTANVEPGQIIENPLLIGIDVMVIPVRILKELKEKEPGCPLFCIVSEDSVWHDGAFIGEDEWFLKLLYKHNYRVLVNTDVQCLHMDLATGNYTAHESVDLNNYVCQIKPNRRLTGADRTYLDNRWSSRIPKPKMVTEKKITKQNK